MRARHLLLATLLSATTAFAAPVTYSYVGNNFNAFVDSTAPAGTTFNASHRITGSLTFSAPLADSAYGLVTPVSYSFSSGVHTFTNADTLALSKVYLEVVAGLITSWDIQFNDFFLYIDDPIGKQENVLFTRKTASVTGDAGELLEIVSRTSYQLDSGYVNGSAGVWSSDAVTVPEPASLALVGLALAGLLAARRVRSA